MFERLLELVQMGALVLLQEPSRRSHNSIRLCRFVGNPRRQNSLHMCLVQQATSSSTGVIAYHSWSSASAALAEYKGNRIK
jgi:hypothetical protein